MDIMLFGFVAMVMTTSGFMAIGMFAWLFDDSYDRPKVFVAIIILCVICGVSTKYVIEHYETNTKHLDKGRHEKNTQN